MAAAGTRDISSQKARKVVTSRAARTPASAARKAPVNAPTAREPRAAARYERANTSVGTAVTASSSRKKPLSGSSPSAGETSLRNAAPRVFVAGERPRSRDAEQRHGDGLHDQAPTQPAGKGAADDAGRQRQHARERDHIEHPELSRRAPATLRG